MADTRQTVRWSLEQKCLYREVGQCFLPQKTSRQLFDLQMLDRAEQDQRILDEYD